MGLEYRIQFSEPADEDVKFWKMSGQKAAMTKISRLLMDMQQHPITGIGKPEALRFELSGKYSRRIDEKNRIVYEIDEEEKIITIHSLRGHYK